MESTYTTTRRGRRTFGLAVCCGTLLAASSANAQEFTLHLEPAAAFFVDQPQTDRFSPGFYVAVRPGIAIGPVVSLQLSYAALLNPAGEGYTDNGSANFMMAGVRVRPFGASMAESRQLGGLFADFNMGYVRTEELNRTGFDGGLGYNFQPATWLAMGPVVRYGQVIQPDDIIDQDQNDAQFVTLGLNFSLGTRHKEEEQSVAQEAAVCPACPACPECPERPECPDCPAVSDCPEAPVAVAQPCPDLDRDGVCDADDDCPTQIGPPATFGCPIDPCGGAPLNVLVQFQFDSATLPPPKDDSQTMDPVLDAVAQAIAQDPACRVCILGYASEEGAVNYNQRLSVTRAKAVQGYLVARGLSPKRIPAAGMGESCQMVPEKSQELNRRVTFRRLEEGGSCPTDCPE